MAMREAVTVRLYGNLNRYLPADRRQMDVRQVMEAGEGVSALLARLGIPVDEVQLILRNGERTPLDGPLQPGDRISVYPAFQQISIRQRSK